MNSKTKRMNRRSARQIREAAACAMERMEDRVLLSTTLAAWQFDTLPNTTNTSTIETSPSPTSGLGTAYTVGMQSTNANGYAYPAAGAPAGNDASTFLAATGSADTGDNGGSEGGTNGFVWRVESGQDSAAAIGSQGVQFSVPTTGDSGISLQWDMNTSSTGAEAQFYVEYTTDVQDANPTWTNVTNLLAFGPNDTANTQGVTPTIGTSPTDSVYIQTNTSNSSIVTGSYATITGPIPSGNNTSWLNDLTVDLSGITGVNGQANFAFRIVNAATGTAETTVAGASGASMAFKNWRFNDIVVNATGAANSAPQIITNPTNQTIAAGQPVTFTASAAGTPTPTVQWFEGGTPGSGGVAGSGTMVPGATSNTLTFTSSSTAADNGNTYYAEYTNGIGGFIDTTAATLNDTLAAPAVTTQPTAVSTTAGSTVTFTAVASGSPSPTVQWQVSSTGTGGWSNAPGNSTSATYSSSTNRTTSTYSFTSTSGENGMYYQAVFSNSQESGVASNAVQLTLGGTVLAGWDFVDGGALVAGQTILNPAPSNGSGTAVSLGMGGTGTGAAAGVGVYSVYPGTAAGSFTLTVTDSAGTFTTPSISGTATAATITSDLQALNPSTTGSITATTSVSGAQAGAVMLIGDPGATLSGSGTGNFFVALDDTTLSQSQVTGNPDNSNILAAADSGDSSAVNAWRIVGTNGWNSAAPIGTQGAQFTTSTSGVSSIEATFDLYATTQGEGKLQVEYTTDGTDYVNVPAADLSVGSNTNITVASNTSSSNTVQGGFFDINGGSGFAGQWFNGLTVNLTGITGVNNDANFGIRIVNAATGADNLSGKGAALNNTSGNDRLADVQITGNNPVAPIILTQPTGVAVTTGSMATFTASATGYPAPTVQWEVSTNGGMSFTPDTTDPGNTTNTLTLTSVTSGQNSYEYEAFYTNSVGTTPTNPATLQVNVPPAITEQPASQTVQAGSTLTLIAAATGAPAPTVQWQVSSNGGSTWTPIGGATSPILSLPVTESIANNQYEAVFTNSTGTATTNAATIAVLGTPIAEWDFTSGQAASPGGNQAAGTANSPLPTFATSSTDSVNIHGLNVAYDGLPSKPEADIIPLASGVDTSVQDYLWRVRGGGGSPPTGSPGTPDGWSQNAPQDTQGVQFTVNTVGFNNIALNFDWTQGSIGDMQAQYLNASSQWVNIGTPIQATGTDYYGVTAPTKASSAYTLTAGTSATVHVANSSGFYFDQPITLGTVSAIVTGVASGMLTVYPTSTGNVAVNAVVVASPDPTGVMVNLQGISYANNNPNLQVRLVSVYDPALPPVIDGNPFVSDTSHGQYAGGFGLANDIQVIDLDNYVNTDGGSDNADGQNFTLSFGGQTTNTITYTSNAAQMAINIENALAALSNIGSSLVNGVMTPNVLVASTVATNTYTPPGPITAYNGFSVTFNGGALKDQAQPQMTISDANDNVSTWQNATSSTITTTVTAPYTVTANSSLVISVASTTNFTVGNPILLGNISCLITSVSAGAGTLTVTPEGSGSVLAGTSVKQLGATGFVDGGGSWELGKMNFTGDVITGAPGIISNPKSETSAAGYGASFTATAYSETLPTVQWQVSTNGGGNWSNVTGGTVSPTGGVFTQSGNNAYTSTYSFTTDSPIDQNGNEYRAQFITGLGTTDTAGATLTVVPPVAPFALIQPNSTSVQQGQSAFFSIYPGGNPAPTVQWQVSTDGGNNWNNLTDSSTVNGSATNTLTIITANNTSQNGYQYRAQFTSFTTTSSNPVTLTVLPTENVLTDWDFNAEYPTVNSVNTAGPLDVVNPAPVLAGTDNSLDLGGTATPLGMNLPYNPADPASGAASPGAVDAEDITNSGPAIITSTFTENTWRIRGGINSTTGAGNPGNGWSNYVPQYSQGAQFALPTTGYNNVYVTLDWFSTHSGEQDAQKQYTLDGTHWINLGPQIQLYAAGNDDFYGDSSLGAVVPVVFDLTGITGANNDPNFGIRMVNSYNLVLSNQQTVQLNDSSNFTLTFNGQTTGTINYNTTPATMVNNIQAAVGALSGVGPNNVSVSYNSSSGGFVVQFLGTLGTAVQPLMTVHTTSGLDAVLPNDPSDEQTITLNDSSNFTLAFGGQTTGSITYNSTPAAMASAMQSALSGLSNIGSGNVAVTYNSVAGVFVVQFPNATTTQPQISINTTSGLDTASPIYAYANAQLNVNGDPLNPVAYNGSKGNWRLDNIVFHGSTIVQVDTWVGGTSNDWNTASNWSLGTVPTSTTNVVINSGTPTASTPFTVGSLSITGGTLQLAAESGPGTFNLSSLSVTGSGAMDIGNNIVYVTEANTSESTIEGLIQTGYASGNWNGPGINSSTAATTAGRAIGYADNSEISTVPAGDVEFRYTLYGDTNLDGSVNFTDFSNLLPNYNKLGSFDWSQGDFNYDTSVNFTDFSLMLPNYNRSLSAGGLASPAVAVVSTPSVSKPKTVSSGVKPTALGVHNGVKQNVSTAPLLAATPPPTTSSVLSDIVTDESSILYGVTKKKSVFR